MNPFIVNSTCPDCGYVPDLMTQQTMDKKPFDCPRCGVHYSLEDYLHEMHEKFMAQKHNHATADLSNEDEV